MTRQPVPEGLPEAVLAETLFEGLSKALPPVIRVSRVSPISFVVVDRGQRLQDPFVKALIVIALGEVLDPMLAPLAIRTLYPRY